MNKLLQEEIWKQRVRQMHRKVIRESRQIDEASLYTAFVQPFTDIIKAAKLTGMDILNSLKLQFDMLFTLGTKGMDEAMGNFDKRKADIEKDWAPLMERVDKGLSSGDADLIALVLAPTAFLTTEAAMAAYDSAESFAEYMDKSGWSVPLVGSLFGGKTTDTPPQDPKDEDKNILQKLAGLFYFENAWNEGDLILEQEDSTEKKNEKKPPLEDALKKYFEDTGLKEKFEKDGKEILEAAQEPVEELLKTAIPRLDFIKTATSTADVDEFLAALDKAEQEGLDLKAAGMDKTKSGVEDTAKEMAQSKEFRAQTAETAGIEVEKVSDEDVLKSAKKVVFVNAKQNFDKTASEKLETLKKEADDILAKISPDEMNMNIMNGSEQGRKFVEMINDAKQKLENI